MTTTTPSQNEPVTLRIAAGGNLVASTVEEHRKAAMEALDNTEERAGGLIMLRAAA